MRRVGLVGLCQIEFPTRLVRLCDGGFQRWGEAVFRSADEVFGTIGSVEALGEGVGAEVPALVLTLMPPGTSQPAEVTQPGFQRSRARFWIAEYDLETHAIVGTPDLLFDGQVDRTILNNGETRDLDISIVSLAERLFEGNIGNSLSPNWHKSIWPGELGHDNATGLSRPVAWGTEKPPTGGAGTYTVNPYASQDELWRAYLQSQR